MHIRVAFENFLGYLVTQRGIKVDPDQISAILNMKSPTCVKEVQMLNRHLAALNRFISRSTDKCKPFFQVLKNGDDFHGNKKCETAFQGLKRYMASPSLLFKPISGEMSFLYLAVSKTAVSRALIYEDEGIKKPVYCIRHSMNEPQTRYQKLEKLVHALFLISRKLKHYRLSRSRSSRSIPCEAL